jgi:hypothetical protein
LLSRCRGAEVEQAEVIVQVIVQCTGDCAGAEVVQRLSRGGAGVMVQRFSRGAEVQQRS